MPTRPGVRPWPDEVLDHLGFDPRSSYVEDFWLGVLGPPSTSIEPIKAFAGCSGTTGAHPPLLRGAFRPEFATKRRQSDGSGAGIPTPGRARTRGERGNSGLRMSWRSTRATASSE
jgi:hypothetical protein